MRGRVLLRKVRKTKSSERWLKAIRKNNTTRFTQTVLFFGLTPSSGALRFSKPFSKVASIPRPSSQKDARIPPCRFLRSSVWKFARQSRKFKAEAKTELFWFVLKYYQSFCAFDSPDHAQNLLESPEEPKSCLRFRFKFRVCAGSSGWGKAENGAG